MLKRFPVPATANAYKKHPSYVCKTAAVQGVESAFSTKQSARRGPPSQIQPHLIEPTTTNQHRRTLPFSADSYARPSIHSSTECIENQLLNLQAERRAGLAGRMPQRQSSAQDCEGMKGFER